MASDGPSNRLTFYDTPELIGSVVIRAGAELIVDAASANDGKWCPLLTIEAPGIAASEVEFDDDDCFLSMQSAMDYAHYRGWAEARKLYGGRLNSSRHFGGQV